MTAFLENIAAFFGALVSFVAGLIELVLGLFMTIGKDERKPAWIRILAVLICLSLLAGIVVFFWTWIAMIAAAAILFVIAVGFFSA